MTEILPSIEESESVDVESYIGLLMQQEASEGAVSSEHGDYLEVLRKWNDGEIDDKEAKEQANQISAGRQANYH